MILGAHILKDTWTTIISGESGTFVRLDGENLSARYFGLRIWRLLEICDVIDLISLLGPLVWLDGGRLTFLIFARFVLVDSILELLQTKSMLRDMLGRLRLNLIDL